MALLVLHCGGGGGDDDDDSGEVGRRRRRRATRMRVHGQGAMDSLLPLLHTQFEIWCSAAQHHTCCILSPCPEATQRARRSAQLHQRMKRANLGGRRAHSNRLPSLCPRSPLSSLAPFEETVKGLSCHNSAIRLIYMWAFCSIASPAGDTAAQASWPPRGCISYCCGHGDILKD